ncbi:hypothetical protein FB566_4618 [Stackebrandtia endophytica]|uniref:ThuA-like domain-containing protein n=1 Tax=Stackebrandtia endophytica TaxID=1496996 RepID=A0A543B2F8_9ACTN|nr:ThuA domain-containing protein [Stackebrandtia endophytica]TQL79018.1 hypothetical protein FB566_4618 [Stackebrandtia endophytica]
MAITIIAATVMAMVLAPPAAAVDTGIRVLVFTAVESEGDEHLSTDSAIEFIEMSGRRHGFTMETTDDSGRFTSAGLADYDVVVWLNNVGEVLNERQRDAFEDWYRAGGGFVGIHAAGYAEPEWTYFDELLGARPRGGERDKTSQRTITVNTEHPAASNMPTEWTEQEDQWYRFDRDPEANEGTTILATIPSANGDVAKPIVWCREFDGGRSWYTAMGHRAKSYEDGDYMKMLRGGIAWVAGSGRQPLVENEDSAPAWPYSLSFIAWVAAVAAGGGLAVRALNRRDTAAEA